MRGEEAQGLNKWLIITACAAGLMAATWYASIDRRPYDRLASYGSLVESFSGVVFEADNGPRGKLWPLKKWAGPIRAKFLGNHEEWHRAHVAKQFRTYERLTGLPFSFDDQNANMEILFSEEEKRIVHWARSHEVREETIAIMLSAACSVAMVRFIDGPQSSAFVSLRKYPTRSFLRRCLVEETVQALGLPADLATYNPSIFSNDPGPEQLSINDKLLIRALYDPRLKPQMAHAEAMPIAREIIRELHDAVLERGVEALYQR